MSSTGTAPASATEVVADSGADVAPAESPETTGDDPDAHKRLTGAASPDPRLPWRAGWPAWRGPRAA